MLIYKNFDGCDTYLLQNETSYKFEDDIQIIKVFLIELFSASVKLIKTLHIKLFSSTTFLTF